MLRRSFVSVAAIIGLVLAALPASAAVPTNINVSQLKNNQTEAAIAVDPTNPQNVVVVSNLEKNYGLMLGVSHDGGATFLRSTFANGTDPRRSFGKACCDPTMSWDTYGNLFLVWLDGTDYGIIRIALSIDAGDTWTQIGPYEPAEPPSAPIAQGLPTRTDDPDGRGSSVDQPTVTTGAGAVWMAWNNKGSMQAVGAAVNGLGILTPFGAAQDIPNTKGCSFGDIAVGPTGQVMQVCTRDFGSPRIAEVRTNLDPDGLGPDPFGPTVSLGTTNVQQFEPITPQRRRTVDSETGLAWDRSGGVHDGRLYVIFTDSPNPTSSRTDIYMRTSEDDGATWTNRVRVNAERRGAQFLPRIALDQSSGLVAIGWHDCQNDVGDNHFGDTDGVKNDDAMYYMTMTDGSGVFAPEVRVSKGVSNAADADNGIDFGDYTGLAFQDGVVHPAWADNSNSTHDNPNGKRNQFDVYTASVPAT
ncbi:MAG: sialidase family protein [Actinomycetota bacterium]